MIEEYTKHLPTLVRNAELIEIIITVVGGLILWALKKWVRPIARELGTGKTRLREGDKDVTLKDLIIESFRSMEGMSQRMNMVEEAKDIMERNHSLLLQNQADIIGLIKDFEHKFERHLDEVEQFRPLVEQVEKHLREHDD